MPYRRAHLAVWFLIGLTFLAFWPGYLSRLGTSVWQHHFHGLTALAWMLLLIAQSMLIDRRDRVRHRWLGRAMVVLVPLFCSAGFLVVQTMQRRTDVFRATMGDRLMWVDGLSTVVFAFLCYQALAHRRNAALHGGYLLATPLPLIVAVVTRLPLGLVANGTPLPAAFHPAFNLSMVITLACVVALWRWQPQPPRAVHYRRRGDRARVGGIPSRSRGARLGRSGSRGRRGAHVAGRRHWSRRWGCRDVAGLDGSASSSQGQPSGSGLAASITT